ncbi:MAG: Glu/Leu/Phe/Val dehydrogenase [Candidatus Marinimicrobia bacterium]|jgi:leucine dehydrogenase|nr:Glu/Leu/Phe/Val dehydrogenase [Candidatus Neomarinimicrobiota bacterium]MBT3633792.1 Glu/Leu/Phe/Val dehydrogenase [Candidatus Neomarinimicrobiota bacterium]MBT3682584.1 Glu/Leu/Phe/Val dehydrogenase [Candidatus Neomarinimicrobiota bacterium]MBT3759348.1 Glu/Leu/Phe/Val dehydrogenase [Candidatus Neomarinimicrobiota bacterium]MBT3894644.1 Glu/Leu/Phe/Val dehydrogenase [Candidatus Neomarinimicrobiota bacterium]
MKIFDKMNEMGHEQFNMFHDPTCGLKAIVAIHNTTLGPALGGCRFWNYNSEDDAMIDVLRLSQGMTYKAAIAGLNLGGGKSVIFGDAKKLKSERLFRSFGRFIEGLGGRYITAEDVNTSVRDMEHVKKETNYVTGISSALGGSGDPSPVTALGVYVGIKASVKERLGLDNISGLKIAIQGLGHVGQYLTEYLHKDGAELFVTDIEQDRIDKMVRKFGATPVAKEDIHSLDVDVYAPCALGAAINDVTIPELKCSVVAGAANNQLAIPSIHGAELKKRNILYAPDYAINAGGLINVSNELEGYNREKAFNQAEGIYDILCSIFKRAKEEDIPNNIASDILAEERIHSIGGLKSFYLSKRKTFKIRSDK